MAAQQTWTEWLFGTYNSAASPTSPASSTAQQTRPATSPTDLPPVSTSSSGSPYGPYVRTGRGGAGNFTWQPQQNAPGSINDLEAHNPSTLSERRRNAALVEHLDTGMAIKSNAAQKPTSQYVRVGRGFVHTDELQQPSHPKTSDVLHGLLTTDPRPVVAHSGRGGSGNYEAAAEFNAKVENEKREQEHAAAERRREKVAEHVQNTLPAPPDAWLGGRRHSSEGPVRDV